MVVWDGTSGLGQQSTFSVVPGGQCPEVTSNAKDVARIVEVDELLQALDVAVVKELLLEVRPGRLGGGTLWRCHGHIARRRRPAFGRRQSAQIVSSPSSGWERNRNRF